VARGGPLTCELYDPPLGTWSGTGSLPFGRYTHTATLLSNGKVLVAGGLNNGGPLCSAEFYKRPNINRSYQSSAV